MESYKEYPGAGMVMREDTDLTDHLIKLMRIARLDVAIESGTFLGLGSTKFIADCFIKTFLPKRFVTIEVNFSNWCSARANLRGYPFVDSRWGSTVEVESAVKFIESDEMLRNHQDYHGIYIDHVEDPVGNYTREVRAQHAFSNVISLAEEAKLLLWDGDDLLTRLLRTHADHRPLIILDSAGGIGLLEFHIVLEQMKDRPYFLLLDDIHHIKHYRSMEHIRNSSEFDIIAKSDSWVLAAHLV